MSNEVGYHIAPRNKYYVETTTVVEVKNETIKNSNCGFIDTFGKDREYEGEIVKDKSEMMKHDFMDFITQTVSSDVELKENEEKNKNKMILVEKFEGLKEKKDEEISKKLEEKYEPIEKYDKTTFVNPIQVKKKGFITKIKEKLLCCHKKMEEEHATPPLPVVVGTPMKVNIR